MLLGLIAGIAILQIQGTKRNKTGRTDLQHAILHLHLGQQHALGIFPHTLRSKDTDVFVTNQLKQRRLRERQKKMFAI